MLLLQGRQLPAATDAELASIVLHEEGIFDEDMWVDSLIRVSREGADEDSCDSTVEHNTHMSPSQDPWQVTGRRLYCIVSAQHGSSNLPATKAFSMH